MYNNWNPNEDELKELVYVNPTATAIMASYMFDYGGGIYDDEQCCNYPDTDCGQNINHAVTVVGYGSEDGQVMMIASNATILQRYKYVYNIILSFKGLLADQKFLGH